MDELRTIEAALFIANRFVTYKDLGSAANVSTQKARELVQDLKERYDAQAGAIEVVSDEEKATLQVRPQYLNSVSRFSKETDLSKKATRILALVAKKKQMLQSELKRYFRGEIYAYVTELKEAGYIEATKHKNTRLLRPTQRFAEHFQMGETQ
ncbi:MAG: SMC-Scp complex subunit ScpB [Candidatus Micrarchaeota archaeon]